MGWRLAGALLALACSSTPQQNLDEAEDLRETHEHREHMTKTGPP
jgi:hypothetical protein